MTYLKPMRAGKMADLKKLQYPLYASYKLDGIRATIQGNEVMSKSNHLIPNGYVQSLFGRADLHGMDGELVVGPPNLPTTMATTMSGVMKRSGTPPVVFYVFDDFSADFGYYVRWKLLKKRVKEQKGKRIIVLEQRSIANEAELLAYEQEALDLGYEGLMLRHGGGPYKHGTSTEREALLLKMKRFEDAEAMIIGFTERMHNENEKDAHGKRGTSKSGKSGLDTLGSLLVIGINGKYKGVEFDCPVPRPEDQALIWSNRPAFLRGICKYKFFPSGTKDKPRFPGFLGMRDRRDL